MSLDARTLRQVTTTQMPQVKTVHVPTVRFPPLQIMSPLYRCPRQCNLSVGRPPSRIVRAAVVVTMYYEPVQLMSFVVYADVTLPTMPKLHITSFFPSFLPSFLSSFRSYFFLSLFLSNLQPLSESSVPPICINPNMRLYPANLPTY